MESTIATHFCSFSRPGTSLRETETARPTSMKTSAAVFAALMLLVAPLAAAEQDASIHLRVSRHKFYVTPMGDQCAYNNCVDPSVYPCQDGTCVRLNYTYGVCDTDSAAGSDDRPENEKFPCPFPNPYADVGSDDEDSADSYSYDNDSDSYYDDSDDVGAEVDEEDEDAEDEDDQ
jgi:hypothetical protein